MAEPKKAPDEQLDESRQLLLEMDALLKRVRILLLGYPKPHLVPKPDDDDKE